MKHFIPCLPLLLWFVIQFLPWIMAANAPTLAPAYRTAADVTMDRLENIRIIDGDTLEADVALGRGVVLQRERIRLQDYDAWETSKQRRTVKVTTDELRKGKLAAEALSSLIHEAVLICLSDNGRDVYGRCLGKLHTIQRDGSIIEAEAWLTSRGHSRDFDSEGNARE